jgi:cation transporter-like permease
MDPMIFLTSGPIPFIFGTIVVLNMLHNSLFAKFTQPLKGVLNCVAALVIGVLLAKIYGALASTVTGVLKPGPPTNDFEIWLATALLGITFPLLIFFAEFFKMWPLQKAK